MHQVLSTSPEWDGTTRNIVPLWADGDVVPWGAEVIVDAKIALGDYSWFRVQSYRDGTTGSVNSGGGGWIALQVPNTSGNVSYATDLIACDPPAPTEVTFYYDRQAAAFFGIAQSLLNNDPGHTIDYINQNNHIGASGNRVTSDRARRPQSTNDWIGYPYYSFTYQTSLLNHGNTGATGSALFMAESIWSGGLPFTQGNSLACSGDDEGFQYCADTTNADSPWRFHTSLIAYYMNDPIRIPSNGFNPDAYVTIDTNGQQNTVIARTYEEHRTAYIDLCGGDERIPTFQTANVPTVETDGSQVVNDSGGDKTWFNSEEVNTLVIAVSDGGLTGGIDPTAFNQTLNELTILEAGDIVWINSRSFIITSDGCTSEDSDNHSFLIVGWGPPLTCDDALDTSQSSASTFSEILTGTNSALASTLSAFSQIHPTFRSNTVPYVVDFPGIATTSTSINGTGQTQRPVPKPFYCSRVPDRNIQEANPQVTRPGTFFTPHSWFFFKMPDSIVAPLSQLIASR